MVVVVIMVVIVVVVVVIFDKRYSSSAGQPLVFGGRPKGISVRSTYFIRYSNERYALQQAPRFSHCKAQVGLTDTPTTTYCCYY